MILGTDKPNILYGLRQVENIVGHEWKGEKEIMRERGERVRGSVLLKRVFGISHEFEHWSNFSELIDI